MEIDFGWWLPAEDGGEEREFIRHYWRRELGIKLLYGGDQLKRQRERIEEGKLAIIATDTTNPNLNNIRALPSKSIILLLSGDETYSLRTMIKIALIGKVKFLVREYPIPNAKNLLRLILALLSNLGCLFRYPLLSATFFGALIKGFLMVYRHVVIASIAKIYRISLLYLPLGYTNEFAEKVSAIHSLNLEVSLLTDTPFFINPLERRSREFFFTGQAGQFDRQLMKAVFQSEGVNLGPFHHGYMGLGTDKEKSISHYIYGLSSAVFSPCPAGNWSRETFRYFESLILGAVPISTKYVLSDPLSQPHPGIELSTWCTFSRESMQQFEIRELKKLNECAKLNWLNQVKKLKQAIASSRV